MAKLVTEYQGFLRFITRASDEIISWFGPHCNYDPYKITYMAAREWDCMADEERQFFIKAHQLTCKEGHGSKATGGSNPYFCYRLLKHYNSISSITSPLLRQSISHPQSAKFHSDDWSSLPKEERAKYAGVKLSELGIDHVIEKRDKLHQMFEPNELSVLELILKTKPKRHVNSLSWFLSMGREESTSSREKWGTIVPKEKQFYRECAKLDKKRFDYETNSWITKLMSIDLNNGNFGLADFETQRAEQSNMETISSVMEVSKDLILSEKITKRPLSSFALFLRDSKDYYKDIKCGRGRLKQLSAAWAELPEQKKQEYRDGSRKLRELRKESEPIKEDDQSDNQASGYNIMSGLFRHSKSINGPSRPSHLVCRLPRVLDVFGKAAGVGMKERKKVWDSLSDIEKRPYLEELEKIKKIRESEKQEIEAKVDDLRKLIAKADELKKIKMELHLLWSRKVNHQKYRPRYMM